MGKTNQKGTMVKDGEDFEKFRLNFLSDAQTVTNSFNSVYHVGTEFHVIFRCTEDSCVRNHLSFLLRMILKVL